MQDKQYTLNNLFYEVQQLNNAISTIEDKTYTIQDMIKTRSIQCKEEKEKELLNNIYIQVDDIARETILLGGVDCEEFKNWYDNYIHELYKREDK